jgi:ribulose-5-phosphate 4-epimerase/fuculose-1-phosphate aldolase
MLLDEGYIKYQARHKQIENFDFGAEFTEITNELISTRDYLHTLGLIGVYDNGIGFGNCSFRTKENQFVITGSATGEIAKLKAKHLCFVNKLDIKNNIVYSVGEIQASSESMTHGAIYTADNCVNSVLHIHDRRAFDFMKLDKRYCFTAQNIPYGTPAMADAIMKEIRRLAAPQGIIVMLGHDEGVISFGENISSALNEIMKVYELSR